MRLPFSLFAAFLLAGWLACCCVGCEKEVSVNMSSGQPQLVVNGFIETGQVPVVVLTKSIGYFAKIDLKTLENSFVHDARISVSDGSRQIGLREYSIDTGGISRFYFYTVDTAQPGSLGFIGQFNRSYHLTIETGGKTYESTAFIPNCKPIDSLIAIAPATPPEKAPTARILNVYYSDPDTPGNRIRYFTQRNSEPYYPGFNSVYDDQIVNGAQNALIPILAGYDRSTEIGDSTGYVFAGDTVNLKWSSIDRGVYNFYNTYEYSLGTVGNPFSSPINVQSNISNGALGIWAGYGSTYYRLIVR